MSNEVFRNLWLRREREKQCAKSRKAKMRRGWLLGGVALACAACISLAACATARKVAGPNGEDVYFVNCGGMFLTMADCLNKAAEICAPAGYEFVMLDNSQKGAMLNSAYPGMLTAMPIINREILVRCQPKNDQIEQNN